VKEAEIGMVSSTNGQNRNAYGILVGQPERKRPLGRIRRRWVVNIKIDLVEIGWSGMDWIDLAQACGGLCEHGNERSGSINCWEVLE
jgi:hypothetical protein